jgi:hypothetical protein
VAIIFALFAGGEGGASGGWVPPATVNFAASGRGTMTVPFSATGIGNSCLSKGIGKACFLGILHRQKYHFKYDCICGSNQSLCFIV